MKILCIAPEHSDVLAATSTLPELSPGISLSWAQRFEDAAFWIFHNRDLAALVLDAKFGHEPCAALLANLHKRGLGAPTIVVADQASSTPSALGLGPDDCLLPRSTLVRDLPAAISRLIEKRQPPQPERDALKAQLSCAEAALREADARHAAEIRTADDRFADRERVLAAEIATLTASHQALERRCVDADAAIHAARESGRRLEQAAAEQLAQLDSEWRDALARELSARQAVEAALSRAERDRAEVNTAHAAAVAELGTRLRERETRVEAERSSSEQARAHLQHQLEEATNARRALEELITCERLATEARETQLRANLEAALTAARDERLALEARLAHVAAEIDDARTRHATEAAAAADRLAKQEHAFAIRVAELAAARDALDARCATVQAAREAERTRAARDAEGAAARADGRERALSERLLREIALREDAERICASLERARADADAEHTAALSAAAEQLRGRDAQIESERAAAQTAYRTLTQQLQAAEQARREAVEAAARDQAVLASQFSEREHALGAEITRLAASSQALESRCADLSDRCAELDARCRDLTARRGEAEAGLVTAREAAATHAAALTAAMEQVAERDERLAEREQVLGRQIDVLGEHVGALRGQLADVVAARDVLAQRLTDADAALQAAQTQAAQDAMTAAARAAEREGEWEARAAANLAAHETQQRAAQAAIADVESRLQAAEHSRRDADVVAARERLAAEAERTQLRAEIEAARVEGAAAQREFEARIREEIDARRSAEGALAALESRYAKTETAHAEALAAAAATLTAREAQQATAHAAAEAALADLERRLRAAEQARRSADESAARDRLASDAQLEKLRTELEATEAEGAAAQRAFEEQLASAVAEHVQWARDASIRERALQESIAAEIDKRQAIERALEEASRSREAAAVAHASESAAAAAELAERNAQLDAERQAAQGARLAFEQQLESAAREQREALDRAAKDVARLQADFDAEFQRAEHERGRLEAQIGSLETTSRDAERQHADAMAAVVAKADQQRRQIETQLGERSAQLEALGADLTERDAACRRLQDEVRASADDIERLRRREVELLASLTAAREESARLLREREEISSRLATSQQEVERLRLDLTASARDVATTREERDALRSEAGRTNQLQRDLDKLRTETDRDFNQHPLPLLRCDLDGTLTQVNHAFARMVDHASADDAQRLTLATDLFTTSNDLRWLVERSRTAGVVTQTESTLRTRDGRCLVVRLMSSATPSGAQVVVQDLAPQRAAQSTLDQARRLEAVGRLGIEVGTASSQLLRDVCRDGERWLTAFDGTRAMRRRVELLIDDVARAAGHLDQLTAFGEQQANAIPSVDLHRVLLTMAPVLRRIAGDEIEIQLPTREDGAPAFEVDVEANRVERLLVNVASYGRDRMPAGGSMRFELAPTVVDRAFIDRYPAVRPGPHVVLTVAEVHRPIRSTAVSTCREELAIAHDDESVPSGGVGVDLAVLQALVRGCEGHLWVDAAACGDLTIRVHLPLKVA